jgi:hypothetical protein
MKKANKVNGNELLLNSLIGKTLDQANEMAGFSGFSIRVVKENGTPYMVTCDLQFTRINVEIENGIVIKNHIG